MATYNFASGKIVYIADLVIDISVDNNASAGITCDKFGNFERLMIVAPATLTNAITLEALTDFDADYTNDASWVDVQQVPGTDLAFAASKAVDFPTPAALALRMKSAGVEGQDDTFQLFGIRR